MWASRAASRLRLSSSHSPSFFFCRSFASVVKELVYADSHEWVKIDGGWATVGITDHAQGHLGDVVYVELPEVGATVKQGCSFGAVESVKATSDINSPVSGKVMAVNEDLGNSPGLGSWNRGPGDGAVVLAAVVVGQTVVAGIWHTSSVCISQSQCASPEVGKVLLKGFTDSPEKVNASPYGNGWIIKVEMSDQEELKSLMDSHKYVKFCEEEDAKH